jgi:hypothetical protein
MLKNKHMRLDQDKIEKAKKILRVKTETEVIDRALEKVIQWDRERLQRKTLFRRIIELRNSMGKMEEDPALWVKLARRGRDFSI